jgi:hypothetical protein
MQDNRCRAQQKSAKKDAETAWGHRINASSLARLAEGNDLPPIGMQNSWQY